MNGITSATYRRLVLDAGQLRIGYIDESNPGALIGATRGGSVFTVDSGIRTMPADGVKGDVKGDKRITRVAGTLVANIVEFASWVIKLAAAGSRSADHRPSGSYDKLVGWWKGENNLLDSVGGNTAIIIGAGSGYISYATGAVGQAFDTTNLDSKYLSFPYNASQTLTPTNTWELEYYIKYSPAAFNIFVRVVSVNPGVSLIYFHYQSSGSILSIWQNSDRIYCVVPAFVSGNWYKLKMRSTAGVWRVWVDDVEQTFTTTNITVPLSDQYYLALYPTSATKIYDEIKIHQVNVPYDVTHVDIQRFLMLSLSKYRSNIALIAEVKDTDETLVCILKNVIGNGGLKMAFTDNDEAVLQIAFQAHFNPSSMDEEPWEIISVKE